MKVNHFLNYKNIMYSYLTCSKLKECVNVTFNSFNENLNCE